MFCSVGEGFLQQKAHDPFNLEIAPKLAVPSGLEARRRAHAECGGDLVKLNLEWPVFVMVMEAVDAGPQNLTVEALKHSVYSFFERVVLRGIELIDHEAQGCQVSLKISVQAVEDLGAYVMLR